jgi:hypothetical protein
MLPTILSPGPNQAKEVLLLIFLFFLTLGIIDAHRIRCREAGSIIVVVVVVVELPQR